MERITNRGHTFNFNEKEFNIIWNALQLLESYTADHESWAKLLKKQDNITLKDISKLFDAWHSPSDYFIVEQSTEYKNSKEWKKYLRTL